MAATTMPPAVTGRNARVLALIGAGHAASHFYLLALPPLFPLLRAEFGVSYAALGLLVTALNLSTAAAQVPAGFLTDRLGARTLLIGGLAMMGGAFALIGLAPTYGAMLALVIVAGIGNSVVHPADYAILSASVDRRWLGRAFSIHTFSGNVGFVLAPATMIALTALLGWRGALVASGALALAVVAALALFGGLLRDEAAAAAAPAPAGKGRGEADGPGGGRRLLLSAPILLLLLFYILTAMTTSGVQSFAVTALVASQGVDLGAANTILTAFLVASAAGILVGGVVADRTDRYVLVTASAFGAAAASLLAVGLVALPAAALLALLALAGLLQGSVRPARDMMVRAVTPPGATGRVFAFVMTGLNVGAAITPVLFGLILDLGDPRWLFVLTAAFLLAAVAVVVLAARWAAAARPAAADSERVAAE